MVLTKLKSHLSLFVSLFVCLLLLGVFFLGGGGGGRGVVHPLFSSSIWLLLLFCFECILFVWVCFAFFRGGGGGFGCIVAVVVAACFFIH